MITAQEAAKELRDLHGRHGSRFVTDANFCASVVKDCLTPRIPIEAPLLAEAATRGVVDAIGKARKGRKAQGDLARIAADFARDTGHDAATASWVVSSWAMTMGVVNSPLAGQPSQFPTPPPPSPYPPPPIPAVAPPHPGRPVPPPPASPARRVGRGLKRLFFMGVLACVLIVGAREGWWRNLKQWIDTQTNKSRPPAERMQPQAPRTSEPQQPLRHAQPETPRSPATDVPAESWTPPSRPSSASMTPKVDLSVMSITIVGNDISLNGQRLGRAQLQSLLEQAAKEDKNRSIEILYDEGRETGQLNEVKEMCRKAGLRRLWVKTVDVR